MRHFLCVTLAPGMLARSVFTRSAVALLIPARSATQRFAPANLRAAFGAVEIAAVAAPADAYLLGTVPTAIQPIGLFARPHLPRTRHWTTPRIAGITATQTRLYTRVTAEGPGFFPGIYPGLRLSGVRTRE